MPASTAEIKSLEVAKPFWNHWPVSSPIHIVVTDKNSVCLRVVLDVVIVRGSVWMAMV